MIIDKLACLTKVVFCVFWDYTLVIGNSHPPHPGKTWGLDFFPNLCRDQSIKIMNTIRGGIEGNIW